jgi:arylsulfatase A-like enzyme
MNCGDARLVRPAAGAWVTYGLGTENQNLPGFVAMCPGGYPIKGTENWRSAFLPGVFQGTYVDTKKKKVEDLVEYVRHPLLAADVQRRQVDLTAALDRQHLATRQHDPALEARLASMELAWRMQFEAADAFDVSREPAHVLARYGDTVHGRQMLIARRLVERGVRYVQVWHGAGQPWDSHDKIAANHRRLANESDGPIGALLDDLVGLGLLESTLVLWGGEFGRTPTVELQNGQGADGSGRDHNHHGFSVWLAGGGVKGGTVYGATDEFGFKAVEKPVHVHDLQATMLHILGLDHTKLTYRHSGRDFRLTDVHGRVITDWLA